MAAGWTTVRVFISSTFRDMHQERDHPNAATFKILEFLRLCGALLRSEDTAADVISVLGKTGPVEIRQVDTD